MESLVTLRLDEKTREHIARAAKRKGVSASAVIRQAIASWMERERAGAPYEQLADLIGVVRGGNPKRSVQTGRQLSKLLKKRSSRS